LNRLPRLHIPALIAAALAVSSCGKEENRTLPSQGKLDDPKEIPGLMKGVSAEIDAELSKQLRPYAAAKRKTQGTKWVRIRDRAMMDLFAKRGIRVEVIGGKRYAITGRTQVQFSDFDDLHLIERLDQETLSGIIQTDAALRERYQVEYSEYSRVHDEGVARAKPKEAR
jgi:hypothetical protein